MAAASAGEMGCDGQGEGGLGRGAQRGEGSRLERSRSIRVGRRHALLLAALALGCETAQQAGETLAFGLNPFATTDVVVIGRDRHGPYLFAEVRGRQLDERFVAPDSEACARVLAPEAELRFAKQGSFGRFTREGEACDAVGTLSLDAWRNRQPRDKRRRDSVVPRSTARFRVVHRDEQYIFLRGRFALASRVGVPAAFDVVALLPDSEPCRDVASRREASLEFRFAGREPFQLLASGRRCVVAGFAMPVEGLADAA
jgi:hypothetical protein